MEQARFELEKSYSGDFATVAQALEIGLRERDFSTVEVTEQVAVFQGPRRQGYQMEAIVSAGRVTLEPSTSGIRLSADFAPIVKVEKVLSYVRWIDRVVLIAVAVWLYTVLDEKAFAAAPIVGLLINELVFHFVLPKTFRRVEADARDELVRILTAAIQAAG